ERNDPGLAQTFAALGDFYVDDAFGSAHRAHASTEALARTLKPAVAGFLMERELRYLGEALEQPRRPFVAVLGGAKISGKIDVIEALLPKVDEILVGGAMANTFFLALGFGVGGSLVERDKVDLAKGLLARAGKKLILPRGAVVAPSLERAAERREVLSDKVPLDCAVFDIDETTRLDYRARLLRAKTVVWNGPMGVFEHPPFDAGTRAVAVAMVEATRRGATTTAPCGSSRRRCRSRRRPRTCESAKTCWRAPRTSTGKRRAPSPAWSRRPSPPKRAPRPPWWAIPSGASCSGRRTKTPARK